MRSKTGFSLLEISLVIFIMGLTITALLQMLDWSHLRYREISRGWQQRAGLAEIRVWLREKVTNAELAALNVKAINEAIRLPAGFLISELKVTKHDDATYFIKLGYFEDRNRNGKPESNEMNDRLFCFRRRSG